MTERANVGAFARCCGALLVAAGLLAGCAGPRYPLYSPVQATGTFGFAEEQLGNDRYRVTYRAPIRRGYELSPAERQRVAEHGIELAYDMALMRAAELALAAGAPRFDVSERRNDIDADVRVGYAYYPYYDPFPYRPYYRHRLFHPWGYAPVAFPEERTEVAVAVSFLLTLHRTHSAGGFDAQETLQRLRSKYPHAAPSAGT